MITRGRALTAVVFLIILGFALRLHQITLVPLRGDEAFTVLNWMRQPLSETLLHVATIDPHPPLAYALFRGWGLLAGTEELAARLLPALISLLGIPALYGLGSRLSGRGAGLLVALLWSLHPLQIWHAQDARNYAIWAGLSAVALWLALRAVERRRPLDWTLYLAAALVAAYIYYLELFTLLVLNLYVLLAYWRRWGVWRPWLLVQGALGFGLALWFLQPRLLTGSGYGGTTGSFVPERLLTWFLPELTFGSTLPPAFVDLLWLPLALLLGLALTLRWRVNRRQALLLGLLAVLPPLLLGLVSLRLNVFTPRYVLAAAPAYTLLFVLLVQQAVGQGGRSYRAAGGALLACWLAVYGLGLYGYYYALPEDRKAPDWRGLAAYLQANVAADDRIVLTSVDPAFTYYFPPAAGGIGLPAGRAQPAEEIITVLDTEIGSQATLWVVARTFPDWPNAGVVEAWAGQHLQPVRQTDIAGTPVRQFKPWEVGADEIEGGPLAAYDTVAVLAAARSFGPEPAGTLTVWLYWRPLGQTADDLKVFVHLYGPVNPATGTILWSQDDDFPQGGRLQTSTWQAGGLFRDVYVLPLEGLPSGTYQLAAGLYNPQTEERILTVDGRDAVEIGQLVLR